MGKALLFILYTEYIYQLLIAEFLCAKSLSRRSHFGVRALISVVFCTLLYSVLLELKNPFAFDQTLKMVTAGWKYLVLFIASVGAMKFSFNESIWNILFCCSAAQALQHLAHRVRNLAEVLLNVGATHLTHAGVMVTAFTVMYALIYYLFFRKLKDKEFPNINNRKMTMTVTTCVIMCLFVGVHGYFDSVTNYVIFDLAMILLCFFILCYQFGFLDNSYKDMEYEKLKFAFQEAQKHYRMTRENIEIINIKCHDIRQQIRLMGKKMQMEKTDLKEITDAVNIYDSTIDTGNPVLDVILTDKSIYCDQNNIRFGCMIDGQSLTFIQPMDIYSLFGNMIDNALEAVAKLDNPEKAIINLNIKTMNGMLFIHCENYFNGELQFEESMPVTTKRDKHFHGYGLKSIRFVVEKYAGAMTVATDGDVFNLNISIPLPEGK